LGRAEREEQKIRKQRAEVTKRGKEQEKRKEDRG